MKKTLAFLVVALAGCGSDPASDVDQFIQNVASQQCAWEFRCCTDPEIHAMDGRKFMTMDDCVPYHQLQLQDQWYLERLAAREGRLRVDSPQAKACLDQMTAMQCNPKPGQSLPPMMVDPMMMDACAKVLVGNTAVGDECIYTHECVDGARCVGDAEAVGRGVCVPYQKEGDICNDDTDCDPTVPQLYCAKQDYHCHVRAELGQKCAVDTSTSPATLLLECDSSATAAVYCDPDSSTCKRLPGDGQACLTDPLPPGVTSPCDPDPTLMLVCVPNSSNGSSSGGTCRAPGKQGDDCSARACGTNLYCDPQSQTCQSLPGYGAECDLTGYQCKKPYFCNSQKQPPTCDQPASVGQDCSQTPCDTGLYCDPNNRVCKTQLPVGAQCTGSPSDECISGLCESGGDHGLKTCQPAATGAMCVGRN